MARVKREYDVLLGVTMTKTVRVKAHSMAEARTLIIGGIADEDVEGLPFTENVGHEVVYDVVRAGEVWHKHRTAKQTIEGADRG